MAYCSLLAFKTAQQILENNGFSHACWDYESFQIQVFPHTSTVFTGRLIYLSDENGVWHAEENNLPRQALNCSELGKGAVCRHRS